MPGKNRCAERGNSGELPMVRCEAVLRSDGTDSGECTVKEHYVNGVHLPGFQTRDEIGPKYLVRKFFTGKEEGVRRTGHRFINPKTGKVKFGRSSYVYEYSDATVQAVYATPEYKKAIARYCRKYGIDGRTEEELAAYQATPEGQAAAAKELAIKLEYQANKEKRDEEKRREEIWATGRRPSLPNVVDQVVAKAPKASLFAKHGGHLGYIKWLKEEDKRKKVVLEAYCLYRDNGGELGFSAWSEQPKKK